MPEGGCSREKDPRGNTGGLSAPSLPLDPEPCVQNVQFHRKGRMARLDFTVPRVKTGESCGATKTLSENSVDAG